MAFLWSNINNAANGFHPTLNVGFTTQDADFANCTLNLFITLPPLVYVDPYELANYKSNYTFQHSGPSDLELPLSAIDDEPSHLLIKLAENTVEGGSTKVPLHLRYGEVGVEEFQSIGMPVPSRAIVGAVEGFIACDSRRTLIPSRVFDRIPSSFQLSFASSRIYHASSQKDEFQFEVPVGQVKDLSIVETGTAATIIVCFMYLVYVSYTTALRLRGEPRPKQS